MAAQMIFRDASWVWEALVKQFEEETGLAVSSINDVTGHLLGKEYETQEYSINTFYKTFKGVEFEIEEEL